MLQGAWEDEPLVLRHCRKSIGSRPILHHGTTIQGHSLGTRQRFGLRLQRSRNTDDSRYHLSPPGWEVAELGKMELSVSLVFSLTVKKPAQGGSFVSVLVT